MGEARRESGRSRAAQYEPAQLRRAPAIDDVAHLNRTCAALDRGHLIPHMSGGEFGPNIFRQDRRLNQGLSEQGKRYRALERAAAGAPAALFFGHLLYADHTAYPRYIEIAVLLPGEALQVEQFDNRPGELSAGPQVLKLYSAPS